MRLRRFEAATVSEALAKVRADLGPDAVILHARETERDRPRTAQHGWVEVTAAIDDEMGAANSDDPTGGVERRGRAARRVASGHSTRHAGAATGGVAGSSRERKRSDRRNVRMLLERPRGHRPCASRAGCPPTVAPGRLRRRGIARGARPAAPVGSGRGGRRWSGGRSRVALQTALGRAFRVRRVAEQARGQRVVALVGPTGVGKTTTLANSPDNVARQAVSRSP